MRKNNLQIAKTILQLLLLLLLFILLLLLLPPHHNHHHNHYSTTIIVVIISFLARDALVRTNRRAVADPGGCGGCGRIPLSSDKKNLNDYILGMYHCKCFTTPSCKQRTPVDINNKSIFH